MKNKGRRQMATNGNCKGFLTFYTRPIEQMGSLNEECSPMRGYSKKWIKQKMHKRNRGYLHTSKGQQIFFEED